MRIIAGQLKGLRLEGPPQREKARPTADKTKESLFNILGPISSGTVVLDAFAGTGQIGLEFLSRGAGFCVFSEKSRGMFQVLQQNVQKAHLEASSEIFFGDVRKNIARAKHRFDYVYLDPPFHYHWEQPIMEYLRRLKKLREGALVILECAPDEEVTASLEGYREVFCRKYHGQTIQIFRYGEEQEEERGDKNE